jgi:hypothetical protein
MKYAINRICLIILLIWSLSSVIQVYSSIRSSQVNSGGDLFKYIQQRCAPDLEHIDLLANQSTLWRASSVVAILLSLQTRCFRSAVTTLKDILVFNIEKAFDWVDTRSLITDRHSHGLRERTVLNIKKSYVISFLEYCLRTTWHKVVVQKINHGGIFSPLL